MDLEGLGFLIGLIGAVWMKSAMNLVQDGRLRPELGSLGQEPESPATRAFVRGLGLIVVGLALETYARVFVQ
jgi:hypothetical protein